MAGIIIGCFVLVALLVFACYYSSRGDSKKTNQLWAQWAAQSVKHQNSHDSDSVSRGSDFTHASVYSSPGRRNVAPAFVPYVSNAIPPPRRQSRHLSTFQMQPLGAGAGPRRASALQPDGSIRNIV